MMTPDRRIDVPVTRQSYDIYSIDISHDGKRLVVVEGDLHAGVIDKNVFIVDLGGAGETRLTTDNDITHAVFSPDDQSVYYVRSPDQRVWNVPVTGGVARKVIDDYCSDISFSPDGRLAACGGQPERPDRLIPDNRHVQRRDIVVFPLN